MTLLNVPQKTGYITRNHVEIYDFRGILFYSSEWAGNFLGLFNLPQGVYHVKGKIERLKKPVKMPLIVLPPKERNLKSNGVNISFDHNPNKATIIHGQNGKPDRIIFDKSFKTDQPLYVTWFIFYHELGHKFYKSEHKADLFAVKMMFKAGFNESQVLKAPFDSLSSKNYFRKSFVIKNVSK